MGQINNSDFLTELSYWHNSSSTKVTLILGWNHRFNNSTVIITNWLIVTKYQFHTWQVIFCLLYGFFFFPLSPTDINQTWLFEQHSDCLIRNGNCLPFASTWVHPMFFGGVRVAHLFSFLCCVTCFVSLLGLYLVSVVTCFSR